MPDVIDVMGECNPCASVKTLTSGCESGTFFRGWSIEFGNGSKGGKIFRFGPGALCGSWAAGPESGRDYVPGGCRSDGNLEVGMVKEGNYTS